MQSNLNDNVEYCVIKNRQDGDVAYGLNDRSWESMVDMFIRHEIRNQKNGPAIIPAMFKDESQWVLTPDPHSTKPSYRNDANIAAISMVILDLDKPGAREKAERMFAEHEFVIYSTHSYTEQTPHKFRMVLKLDNPIPAEDWPQCFRALVAGIDADKVCGNLSRIYYLPSASPRSGITPVTLWHRGRDLTREDIERIGLQFLGDDAKRPVYLTRMAPGEERQARHFSGENMPYYQRIVADIDCSWEGYRDRHRASLHDLIKQDSRHAFALSVIGREISKYGDRADLRSMMQFIFRASIQHSSKAIGDGNTGEEIPEMISSAYIKFAPSVLKNRYSDSVTDLYQEISEHIEAAENSELTGAWEFPGTLKKEKKLTGPAPATYTEMRTRHFDELRRYVTSHDAVRFMESIIKVEGDTGSTDITACVQFAYMAYKGFLTSMVKLQGDQLTQAIAEISQSLITRAKSDDWSKHMSGLDPVEFQTYFSSSLKISEAAVAGRVDWIMAHGSAPERNEARSMSR